MLHTRRRTATPNRVAQVNAYLKSLGLDAKLRRGEGYYYFTGADAFGWHSEYVYRASDLSLDEWKTIVKERIQTGDSKYPTL